MGSEVEMSGLWERARCVDVPRLAGLLLGGRLALSGRAKAAMDAIPPAVLTAVIAPTLLATGWPETLAGAVTILAAMRLPLLAVIGIGVVSVVVLRALAG